MTLFRRGGNITIVSYIRLELDIELNITILLLLYRYYYITIIILLLTYNIILYHNTDYVYSSLACFGEGLYYYLKAFFLYI